MLRVIPVRISLASIDNAGLLANLDAAVSEHDLAGCGCGCGCGCAAAAAPSVADTLSNCAIAGLSAFGASLAAATDSVPGAVTAAGVAAVEGAKCVSGIFGGLSAASGVNGTAATTAGLDGLSTMSGFH